jgi:hypothetical protein
VLPPEAAPGWELSELQPSSEKAERAKTPAKTSAKQGFMVDILLRDAASWFRNLFCSEAVPLRSRAVQEI